MIGTIRISQLPQSNNLTGSESLIVNQNGDTRLTTVNDVVGILTYVTSSGISTNVIGGISSVNALSVTGVSTLGVITSNNIFSTGIITASGGFNIGINSGGTAITSGPVKTFNFIGAGNTFAVNGTTIDISIQGGGGESYWVKNAAGIHTLSNVGIGTTNPTSKLQIAGDINLDDGGSFTTTLQCITPTANRTISLPDATGTVALIGGSSGQAIYNNGGVLNGIATLTYDGTTLTTAGRFINSYTSLASSPAKVFTGTWFTGGTATTTKPHFLIEPTGTTSTGWSTSGTGLGVNAASGFAGRLIDLQVNGTSYFQIVPGSNSSTLRLFGSSGWDNFIRSKSTAGTGFNIETNLGLVGRLEFGVVGGSTGAGDTFIERDAANALAQRNGTNAQTFRVYNTFTDASNYERGKLEWSSNTFRIGTQSAGTGTARPMALRTGNADRLVVDTIGSLQVATALTVATLPGTPAVGMIARVTDASAPAVGSTVAGGGAANALCWYNGTNWTVLGV